MSMVRNIAITLAAMAVMAFFGVCAFIALDVNEKIIGPVEASLKGQHVNGDDGYLVLAQRLMQNSTAAMNAVKQTMQDTNRIARAQEKPAAQLTASSVALVDAGKDTVARLGQSIDSLNGVVADVRTATLPRVNTGVDQLSALVGDFRPAARALTGVLTEGQNAVASVDLAVKHADALLSDPQLGMVAQNLNVMSAQLADGARHVNGAASNAEMALGYVRDDLSPKKQQFWQGILSTALGQAIGIPLKYFPTRVAVTGSVPLPVAPAK